jgi:transposase, IS30 family
MSHLTLEQRYIIEVLRKENYSQTAIAARIGKNKSVIYRELKRNCDARNGYYKADLAERKCKKRHLEKIKKIHFTEEVEQYINHWIKEDYSPEQIVGKAKIDDIKCVSHERIYQHLWKDKKQGGDLYKSLRTQGKRYRKRGAIKDKRGQIAGRVGIEKRPPDVEKREKFGDFELDLIIGKNHKGALVTANDRATGVLKMKKIESKDALIVELAVIELLQEISPSLNTITSDNGKEFANHQSIAKQLEIQYYFANPYCSWERGSNENLNGLVRQYFPKGYDFDLITDERVKEVQEKLNNRPRKRFGFQTPNQVYLQTLNNKGKVAFIT